MTFIGLLFGALLVAAAFGMAKIQRQELLVAREKRAADEARIAALTGKSYRPCD